MWLRKIDRQLLWKKFVRMAAFMWWTRQWEQQRWIKSHQPRPLWEPWVLFTILPPRHVQTWNGISDFWRPSFPPVKTPGAIAQRVAGSNGSIQMRHSLGAKSNASTIDLTDEDDMRSKQQANSRGHLPPLITIMKNHQLTAKPIQKTSEQVRPALPTAPIRLPRQIGKYNLISAHADKYMTKS